MQLPQSITTEVELEDIDIPQLIAKAQFLLNIPLPVPIAGKLSMKASATIPLGRLRDLKSYAFHGDVTLRGASIHNVDFGHLTARFDLADGVLEIKGLRGRLVDRPDGGPDNPPDPTAPVAAQGPLATGEFRGDLRASLAPLGPLSARFEAVEVPLGELAAPALPRPTPLSGLASLAIAASANLRSASDPSSWSATGRAESVQIAFHGAPLDSVALRFALKNGRLDLPKFSAMLAGRPLDAHGTLDLRPPRVFDGKVDVNRWDLSALSALDPGLPRPSPIAGSIDAHGDVRGTLVPWTVQTRGQGRLEQFQAESLSLGDVSFRWATEAETLVISAIEAKPFGGRLSAEARVPTVAGKPIQGAARVTGIDTAKISDALPGKSLEMTGKADGQVTFTIPAHGRSIESNVQLAAPDLTIHGIPAEQVQAAVKAHRGNLEYEVSAESLGGWVTFQGKLPLKSSTVDPARPQAADGEFRFVGFKLSDAWRSLGVTGALAQLSGEGAVDANLRDVLSGNGVGLWAHGVVELRTLALGERPLGQLRGIVSKRPEDWRLDPVSGELLGGPARGFVWGTTPGEGRKQLGFNVEIDRASLSHALVFMPELARNVSGFGTLRLAGNLEETLRADAEFLVPQARLAGISLTELRAPAELILRPEGGSGSLVIRRGSARLAGGHVRGDASFRVGTDRTFQSQVQLSGIDLQTLLRLDNDSGRSSSGRISGRISVNGPDPAQPRRYRGKVELDLDDASLVAVPIFRELDRFLGAARGGLFEDGDLVGTIANRQLLVDMLTLEGKLVQLHATGTIGFDSQVNLEVLVNTSQIISETGQSLLSLIPGLRDILGRGRNDQALSRVGSYLSTRLLKLRVTGTLKNPSVSHDPGIGVAETAAGFFAGVLKLPLGLLR